MRMKPLSPKDHEGITTKQTQDRIDYAADMLKWYEELEAHPHVRAVMNIPEDEPIMVLRAQDKFAPAAAMSWQMQCVEPGTLTLVVSEEKMNSASDLIQRMCDWQREHPDRVKTPD